jgi:uncharacterized cupin superfamily protein
MEHASVADAAGRVDLTAALGTTDCALNRYRLAPGEGFPSGLHAHGDQEEVFVVQAGTATFETLPDYPADPTGEVVTVEAGEAVRFAPGEFQTGFNDAHADEELVALALGAPRDSEDVHVPVPCPDCAAATHRLATDGGFAFRCPRCGAERVPAPCPDCGSDDLAMRLGADDRPVARCADCEAEFDRPPVRDGW